MNDIHVLARSVIGGFGGTATVTSCPAIGPLAGQVRVSGTDAYGNVGEITVHQDDWRAAIKQAITDFPS